MSRRPGGLGPADGWINHGERQVAEYGAAAFGTRGTHTLLDVSLRRLGIDTAFVPAGQLEALGAAIRPAARSFSHAGAVRGFVTGELGEVV